MASGRRIEIAVAGTLIFLLLAAWWEVKAIRTPPMPPVEEQRALLGHARARAVEGQTGIARPNVANRGDVRGVLVTVYYPGLPLPPSATWSDVKDGDVLSAVDAAARDLFAKQRRGNAESARVRIDLAGKPKRVHVSSAWLLARVLDPGIDGLLLRNEAGRPYALSPSHRVETGMPPHKALEALRRVANTNAWPHRFRAASFVEGPGPERAPQAIVRGNVLPPYPASAQDLRDASTRAGSYLGRMVDANGKFVYLYDAVRNSAVNDYNLLRHAGTLWSMFQIVRMNGDPAVRASAERGLDHMVRLYAWRDPRHPDAVFLREGRDGDRSGDVKLGACGLGILAYVEAERAGVKLSEEHRSVMIGLGHGILAMQKPDGELRSYHTPPGGKENTRRSVYYPGEAILALTELHVILGDQKWLDAARRAADFQVERRWNRLGVEMPVPPDAWLAQALEKLWVLTKDAKYERYAYRIADELLRTTVPPDSRAPMDLWGGMFEWNKTSRATPTASRNEAVVAVARLARAAGEKGREERYLEYARASAWFGISQQYRAENSHFLRAPAIAAGGIREGMTDNRVRIDGVQHAVSGVLGLADLLEPRPAETPKPAVTATNGEGT